MDKSKAPVTVVSNGEERKFNPVKARKWFRHFEEGSNKQKPVPCGSRQFRRRGDPNLLKLSPGRSSGGEEYWAQTTAPPTRTLLNPSAKEWNPLRERAPEEDRCLFLTFSNGYPLVESQVIRFFTNKFGPCVEKVYVHRPEAMNIYSPPLFGKVVFSVSYIPAVILRGDKQTKFMVDGKPLWCKKFEGKKKQAHDTINSVQLYQC